MTDSRVFYRDRPEWADIAPIAQPDGLHTACAISYSEDYIDCMDYFRAVLHKNEMSERAFELTTGMFSIESSLGLVITWTRFMINALALNSSTADVISYNPANYTAWHFRRLLLKALEKDIKQELEFCTQIAEENLKNYQVSMKSLARALPCTESL